MAFVEYEASVNLAGKWSVKAARGGMGVRVGVLLGTIMADSRDYELHKVDLAYFSHLFKSKILLGAKSKKTGHLQLRIVWYSEFFWRMTPDQKNCFMS